MNQIQQAIELGTHLKSLSDRKQELLEQAKGVAQQMETIEKETLPSLLEELGITSFTLEDGTVVRLEEFPVGRLSPKNKAEAFQWLMETNNDGIIKNEYKVQLGMGDLDKSRHIRNFLEELDIPYNHAPTIHPATLKAFIKEMAEQEDFPRDLFNVYDVKQVSFSE